MPVVAPVMGDYRDPKLANYFVQEHLEARPRKFEWDPEPCFAFGGKKYPKEPMPRKVTWRAAGNQNYYDLGRGGCIPLPRKLTLWERPGNLDHCAPESAATRGATPVEMAEAAKPRTSTASRVHFNPDPDSTVQSKGGRSLQEQDKTKMAQLQQKNEKAWAAIRRADANIVYTSRRVVHKVQGQESDRQARESKKQRKREAKEGRMRQKLVDKERKKQLQRQRKQQAIEIKVAAKRARSGPVPRSPWIRKAAQD
ncbi:hypothetical protein GQ53DRAFT_839283 [Thozetella sp. PMI_491]|nr:hypothetical protein GQ53DRAFT_839283 [Thozetella sp. PMI_491]